MYNVYDKIVPSQLQTQQVMMSEIGSHIEYLTDLYSCAHIDEKFSLNDGF